MNLDPGSGREKYIRDKNPKSATLDKIINYLITVNFFRTGLLFRVMIHIKMVLKLPFELSAKSAHD